MRRRYGVVIALACAPAALALGGCLSADLADCGDRICPPGTACAPGGTGCFEPERIEACADVADGEVCSYDGASGTCDAGVCFPLVCGDGIIVAPEQCEGTNLNGLTCRQFGFYEPEGLACTDTCVVDTAGCVGSCGDGLVNGPELCDTVPGDVFTCYEVGYDYGSPECSDAICAPVYASCAKIGWTTYSSEYDYVADAAAPSPGDFYLLEGFMNYTRFHGSGFTEVPAPTDCLPVQIAATPEGVVFLGCNGLGSSRRWLARRALDGSWQEWDFADDTMFSDILMLSETDVYAIGPWVMHFDGSAWTEVATGAAPGTTFYGMHGRSGGPIVITSSDGLVLFDGTTWTVENGSMTNPWVSPTGTIYAIGANGVRRRTVTSTWTPLPLPDGSVPDRLWGNGTRDLFANTSFNRLWHHDGTAWLEVESPEWGFEFLLGSDSHVVGVWPYGRFYESSGHLWTVPSPAAPALDAIWVRSATDVIAIGSGDEFHFDGDRWTLAAAIVPNHIITRMWGADDGSLFAIGGAGVRMRRDAAGVWRDEPVSTAITMNDVWGVAPDRVFAIGYESSSVSGHMYLWNGSTWSEVLQMPYRKYSAIWGTPELGVYVTTDRFETSLMHLAPGADPVTGWTTEPLPYESEPSAVWADATRVFVGYLDGRIVKRENGAWTEMVSRVPGSVRFLAGDPDDVFGIVGPEVVHWDGAMWDRVRLPESIATLGAVAVHAAGGAVAVVGANSRVVQLVRPGR